MDAQGTCQNCAYFYQQYVKTVSGNDEIFTKIYQGHCGKPRLKNRRPDAPACDRFEPCEETEG